MKPWSECVPWYDSQVAGFPAGKRDLRVPTFRRHIGSCLVVQIKMYVRTSVRTSPKICRPGYR